MLGYITYKTEFSELLDIDEIYDAIMNYKAKFCSYYTAFVEEPIKSEINTGGLDKYSLNLGGETPANTMANSLLNDFLEMSDFIENLYNKAMNDAREQRLKELSRLGEKVSEHLEELNKELVIANHNLSSSQENYQISGGVGYANLIESYNSRVTILEKEIIKYQEKLAKVKAYISDIIVFSV